MNNIKNRNEQISDLISSGVVGVALGKILTGKSEKTLIASLVGIAVTATYKAFKLSKEISPVLIIDNKTVYEIDKNDNRKFIKHLPKLDVEIPDTFKIA